MRPAPRTLVLLASTLFLALLSGCVSGEDTPDAATDGSDDLGTGDVGGGDGTDGNATAKEPEVIVEVDEDTAVFAPEWSVGQTWTYEVSGPLFPAPYTTTLGVVEVTDTGYVLASDSEEERKNDLHHGGGLFLAGIDKATLAPSMQGVSQDLFGFQRPLEATWDVTLFDSPFTLTKAEVTSITHAGGPSRGIMVSGTGGQGNLTIEYGTGVGGLTLFRWTEGAANDVVLEYRLTASALSGDTAGFARWTQTDFRHGDASGPANHLGFERWESSGDGDQVFLRITLDGATYAGAHITDPQGNVVAQVETQGAGAVSQDVVVDDLPGTWAMVMFTSAGIANDPAGRIDVYVYQLTTAAY